jgi:hypothetical protein
MDQLHLCLFGSFNIEHIKIERRKDFTLVATSEVPDPRLTAQAPVNPGLLEV